ncbi:hypothetical protein [Streptomyces crystallinus]|uniref:hypothetical protein n=1 Tax=Streptomyces crystallinus TaxID=68191 RepID=UPI0031D0E521
MTSFVRKKLLIAGAVTALAAGITVPALAATGAPTTATTADPDTAPPSTVEGFAYPGAAKILADRKVKLIKGDGHIVLADACDYSPRQIKVWGRDRDTCFNVSASTGYLTLEIEKVWGLETGDHPISADLTSESGKSLSVDVPKGKYKSVGEGQAGADEQTTLVELRVTG